MVLRQILGPITLEPIQVDIGTSFYRAKTAINTLALTQIRVPEDDEAGGSNSSRWWTQGDSNP